MTTPPSIATEARLRKAALDNSVEAEPPRDGHWLAITSTQAPLPLGETLYLAALSQPSVAHALAAHAILFTRPLSSDAVAARDVTTLPALHDLVRRAWHLSRALPREPLHALRQRTRSLPAPTETERLVVQRVGQDFFRDGLLDGGQGRCAVTGLAVPAILHASHIKPWAECATDAERLDVFNGLLLAAQLDAGFHQHLIPLADDGAVLPHPTHTTPSAPHPRRPQCVRALTHAHRTYDDADGKDGRRVRRPGDGRGPPVGPNRAYSDGLAAGSGRDARPRRHGAPRTRGAQHPGAARGTRGHPRRRPAPSTPSSPASTTT